MLIYSAPRFRFGTQRQDNHKIEFILCCLVNSRLAWATEQDPVKRDKKIERRRKEEKREEVSGEFYNPAITVIRKH